MRTKNLDLLIDELECGKRAEIRFGGGLTQGNYPLSYNDKMGGFFPPYMRGAFAPGSAPFRDLDEFLMKRYYQLRVHVKSDEIQQFKNQLLPKLMLFNYQFLYGEVQHENR